MVSVAILGWQDESGIRLASLEHKCIAATGVIEGGL
jgi:hypothetical protein